MIHKLMKFRESIQLGDPNVAVLENWGGRPTIAGPDPARTQENLLRIVKGMPLMPPVIEITPAENPTI